MSRESVLEHVMLDSRITVSVKKPDADSLVRYEFGDHESSDSSRFSLDLL